MVRVAAELLGGRSLGQVLMSPAGEDGVCAHLVAVGCPVLSQELSPA